MVDYLFNYHLDTVACIQVSMLRTLIPFHDFRPFSGVSDVSCDVSDRAPTSRMRELSNTRFCSDILMPKII